MSRLAILAAVALSAVACGAGDKGGSGTDCLKNDDCESGYCSSSKCRPKPAYGGTAGSGGSTGGGGSAGAGGS